MKVGTPQGTGRYHIQAEINMIPLIDVALVLLIIFMVISPILVESQMKVNIPKVTTASKADQTALKVVVGANGAMSFQGHPIVKEALKTALAREIPPNSKISLLIQADKDVPFENVVFVMDIAKQLKIEKLGVSVLPQLITE